MKIMLFVHYVDIAMNVQAVRFVLIVDHVLNAVVTFVVNVEYAHRVMICYNVVRVTNAVNVLQKVESVQNVIIAVCVELLYVDAIDVESVKNVHLHDTFVQWILSVDNVEMSVH